MLVDAEDADVADVVMPAGIHAAGHLDLDVAQVVQVVEIVEALLDLLRDPERAGIGERAEKSSPGQAIMSVRVPMFGMASWWRSSSSHTSYSSLWRTSASSRF